ncbi:MAG: glycine betaine ABC transporter substrate-binding protein [Rubrobacteraceae bacterium]
MKSAPRNNKRKAGAESGSWLLAPLLVVFYLLVAGCSASTGEVTSDSELDRSLTIAHAGWSESAALANLTKVVFEDELDYEVKLVSTGPEAAFEGVARREFDAFQGIWRPRHNGLISEHEGEINMLGRWLYGETRASLAAPSYMEVRRIEDLEGAGRALILDPEASAFGEIPGEVFERHDLEPSVFPDSSAMMDEVGRLYEAEEPFVFFAYSPHWMNLRYDFDYLEGAELLENMNRPSTLHSAARAGLGLEDPAAYVLLDSMVLTEYHIESLQLSIHEAQNPREGARDWAEANEALIESWVEAARSAQTRD